MDVIIENCRSIDRASISIEPGKLNVKFAPNGTGKSSIAKALVSAVNDSADSNLIPFKWLKEGSAEKHPFLINGLDEIASVEIFDEEYVQSVVFQQDSLFPGSFDAFVRTPEFISTERELKEQLGAMVELGEREDVRRLTAGLESFVANLVGNSGLDRNKLPKATTPVVKALKEGNTWEHEDPLLTPFKPILKQGPFKKWAAWHKQGRDYLSLMDGVCPYCGLSVSEAVKRIDAVGNSFDSAKVGNIEKTINALSVGGEYLSEAADCKINTIINSADPITEQEKGFIGKVIQDAQLIIDTLAKLRTVSSYFVLSAVDDLDERLSNCKIDIALVGSFNSSTCSALAAEINGAVEAAMANVGKLKGLVNRQKSKLAATLKGRCEEINAFLAEAGYPYNVSIPGAEDGKCSVRLVHTSMWEVPDSREALSYGEKNAFALVFFAYECMSKKPDLVILDDPISSFDGAKRYALLNMLFLGGIGEATLKGKTVLLLTHDYGTLFDIEHTHKPAFQPSAKSCVLSCTDGVVSELVVGANDMVLADNLYEELAKSSGDLIVKLVYARKVLEVRDDKGDAYDVVSSLFHHRPMPVRLDKTPMKAEEIANGMANLEAIVGEPIDYSDLLDTIQNSTKMLAIFDTTSSNYEKLQLARIATDACTDDKVLKERMDESVHVGNGFLYQLDPTKFELVPSQLVERCREEIVNMDGGRWPMHVNANFAVNVLAAFGTIAAVFVSLYLYWAAQRPDVIAYLSHDRDNGCVLFEVKNLGKGVAEDVSIDSFDFGLVQEQYRDYVRERSFLTKGIPVLVPEAYRNTVVLDGPEIKNFDSVVSQVSLSYKRKGFFGPKTEKRSFPLDYYSFCGSIYKKSDLYKLRIAAEVIAGIRTKEQAKRA